MTIHLPVFRQTQVVCQGKVEILKETKTAYQSKSQFVTNIFESETLGKVILCYSKRYLDDVICSAVHPKPKLETNGLMKFG